MEMVTITRFSFIPTTFSLLGLDFFPVHSQTLQRNPECGALVHNAYCVTATIRDYASLSARVFCSNKFCKLKILYLM